MAFHPIFLYFAVQIFTCTFSHGSNAETACNTLIPFAPLSSIFPFDSQYMVPKMESEDDMPKGKSGLGNLCERPDGTLYVFLIGRITDIEFSFVNHRLGITVAEGLGLAGIALGLEFGAAGP